MADTTLVYLTLTKTDSTPVLVNAHLITHLNVMGTGTRVFLNGSIDHFVDVSESVATITTMLTTGGTVLT
jgi:hypothetical protein